LKARWRELFETDPRKRTFVVTASTSAKGPIPDILGVAVVARTVGANQKADIVTALGRVP
jgi:hypothetical protein